MATGTADRPQDQEQEPTVPTAPAPPAWFAPGTLSGKIALGLWAVAAVIIVVMFARQGVSLDGGLQGLIVPAHRARLDEPMVMVRARPEAEDPAASLRAASLALAQGMSDERVPLAPPANAVTGWLDKNGLYLMPVDKHDELAERLSPAQVNDGVAGLKARLSSPLFGVSGEQARRDPLRLRGIMMRESGMLGFVDDPEPGAPRVTGAGDLLSADGKTLLVQLESDRNPTEIERTVDALLADLPVAASAVGPAAVHASARAVSERAAGRVSIAIAAGLVMILALALRQVRPVIAIVAMVGTVVGGLLVFGPGLDPLTVPLVVLLTGFGCDAALRLHPISSRRWASGLVFAFALAPLWVLPYPLWTEWTLVWGAAMLVALFAMRAALPTLVHLLGGDLRWPVRPFRLAPMPLVSLLICVVFSGLGAWAGNLLDYRDPASLTMSEPNVRSREEIVDQDFFEQDLVVETVVAGEDVQAAIDEAAVLSGELVAHVPEPIRRLESPGSYVIPSITLAERRRSLNELGLAPKLQGVHDTLEAKGLRAAAFSEFLRGAADIEDVPDAERALDGPLGPWMRRYVSVPGEDMHEGNADVRVRTRLELVPRATLDDVAAITFADGRRPPLYGPRIAALEDQAHFGERVAIAIVSSLWLGALLVWLGTRSFALALASAMTALTAQMSVLTALWLLELPFGPHLLPAVMLVGAAAIVASGRACRSVDLASPMVASGILVTGLCQVTAGLTLVASGVEPWREMGMVITIGCAVAAGLGLFVAPGMTLLLRAVVGGKIPAAPPPEARLEDEEANHD